MLLCYLCLPSWLFCQQLIIKSWIIIIIIIIITAIIIIHVCKRLLHVHVFCCLAC